MKTINRVLSALLATIFLSFVPVQSYAAENNPKLAYVYTEINGTAFVSIDNDFYLINDIWISQYAGRYIVVSITGVFDGIGDKLMYPNYNMTATNHVSSVFQVKKVFNNNIGYGYDYEQSIAGSEQSEYKQKPCKVYTMADAFRELGYPNLAKGDTSYKDSSGRVVVMTLPKVQMITDAAIKLVEAHGGCQ